MKRKVLSGFELAALTALLLSLWSGVGTAGALEVTSETVLGTVKFPDRIESSGIYREAVTVPRLNQLFVPVTVLIQNLDTTVRGSTAELLGLTLSGGTQSFGRVGALDRLLPHGDAGLLLQTTSTLSYLDLYGQETVWKIPLPRKSGEIPNVSVAPDGALYLTDLVKHTLRKLDPRTGETLATVTPDPSTGTTGMLAAARDGGLVVFGKNRFSFIGDDGRVQWRAGKVFPERSYGSAHVEADGSVLLAEYVSAANPNETLRRRYWVTLVDGAGHERWNRLGQLRFLASGAAHYYFEEWEPGTTQSGLVSVEKATGNIAWRRPATVADPHFLDAKEIDGRVALARNDGIELLAVTDGAVLAAKHWPDRASTSVLGGGRGTIVVANRLARAPHTYFLMTLRP